MDLLTDLSTILSIITLILLAAIGVVVFLLVNKNEEVKEIKTQHDKLIRSFEDIDEQAKLIVKTDLELNKAQEELDRRLEGLNVLQKIGQEMSMTLDAKDLYQKLDQNLFNELGFSRALIFMFKENKHLNCNVAIGYIEEKVLFIKSQLEKDETLQSALKQGTIFSSANTQQKMKNRIIQLFETEHFIITPIITQHGFIGLIAVGNRYNAPSITEGDEELISILSSQIGQAVENAQLFEQVYNSSQLLETKVKERTRQLESALDSVNKISKKKSEFISSVSHELRTPLTSIKGYASILMTGKIGDIPDAVKERLAKINTHSDNLVGLINDLLDISRIESGRVEMKIRKFDIRNIIENVVDLLTPQLKDKNVNISAEVDAKAPEISIDTTQVERVFINLISNAIKFTPAQGKISIKAVFNEEKQFITCSINDTGIGIKEDDLEKLFDEFYRVDNDINMNVKGTGLGLALAKNIVEAHGGKMFVSSKVNEGTTFSFTLPVEQEQKEETKKG